MREESLTVVFADLAGFTALTDAHGDHDALAVVTRLEQLASAALPEGVRVVKTIGDAVMLAGDDASEAVTAALDVVAAVHAEPRFPLVRAGLNRGSVLTRDGDLFGATVNLAARITSIAKPGQVLSTEPVAAAALVSGCATVQARGPMTFRNLVEPVDVFELDRCDRGVDSTTVVDPVCRMRLDSATGSAVRTHEGRLWAFCSKTCADRFAEAPGAYVHPR